MLEQNRDLDDNVISISTPFTHKVTDFVYLVAHGSQVLHNY